MQIKELGKPLSFTSARELHSRIETLPSPPQWKSTEVSIEGGKTTDPLVFYYRDGLECFRFLFGNPLFRDAQEFIPRKQWIDEERSSRVYDDMMSGDRMWELQVCDTSCLYFGRTNF